MTDEDRKLQERILRIQERRDASIMAVWDDQAMAWIATGRTPFFERSIFAEGKTLTEAVRRIADKIEEREGKPQR